MQNKILISSSCIEVQCDRNDITTQSLLVDIYPITVNRIKTSYKMSNHLVPEILKLLRGIDETNIQTVPERIQNFYFRELMARENVTELLKNGPRKACKVNSALTLRPHQQLGREIAEYYDKFAFFYDTRTGKTPLALSIINDDIQRHPANKWLVVCPLILIYNAWLEDSERFFKDLPIVNCHADTPAKRFKALEQPSNLYVTNTESFVKYREHFDKMNFTGAFVDESSDMKSNKSKVSNELVDFAYTRKRFYLLAGTPAPNGEWEYYMQMRAIDYHGWQQSYTQFKQYYFINVSFNPQYEKLSIRPDRKDELLKTVGKYALYVDKEDVLDTPGRMFHEVEYEMPDELMKHYRRFKNELYLEISEGERITAKNAGAKLNKLNQISSGFVIDTAAVKENKFYGTDKKEWHLLSEYRFDALEALLESERCVGKQVLIWANYHKEFEIIKQRLGDRCACVYGAVNINDKNAALKNFKEGKVQYLVANPASADKGLTLTNAHKSIYFSLNWSYELFKQSYDRIYGDKSIQPNFCDYYIMIAKGTIDRILYSDVLQGKGDASYAILNHLKGGRDDEL